MLQLKRLSLAALSCLTVGFFTSPASAQTSVATYRFNNTLAADEAGVPALLSVDPFGLNGFEDAIIDGQSRRVFRWNGNGNPATQQAGLVLDATGLVSYNNYSVELVFEFLESSQFGGGWRRIIDTQNRRSDNGFYVDPGNRLQVYPVVTGTTLFTTPGFHKVVLTNFVKDGEREVKAYLDDVLQLTSNTDQLNLDNPNNPGHLLHFFLDNIAGPAQNEYADGRISFLRLYDGIIVPSPQQVPEPGTVGAILLTGFIVKCYGKRGKKNHS
jgi:hypothetical protein